MPHRSDSRNADLKADVLVVGSGPGGAVTAALCAEAGKSVLLVEEGAHLPIDSAPHVSPEEFLQKYRNAGVNVAIGRTGIAFVQGRCVGGGSEVNRGLYQRTPDALLDRWTDEFGVRDLTPDALAPHFADCERTARVEQLPSAAPAVSARLGEGARRLGWRSVETPRLYRYERGGGGRRQSMSETFVPRFLAAGGRLVADVAVDRIARSGGRWHASARLATSDGHAPASVDIQADTVFVACGAVETPALLRRSGFRRNIGNALRFHPMLKLVAEFSEDVNIPGGRDPVHQIKQFEPELGMGCSISKPAMLAMALMGHDLPPGYVAENARRMGIYYVQTTGGCATVRNLPFFRDPLVRVRFSRHDLRQLAFGLKRLAEAMFAAGAIAVYPSIPGYPVLRSPADIDRLPDSFAGAPGSVTAVHVLASCPMGERDWSATDSFGKVPGADGLYIADASVLCGPTAVNPQGTVMAVAHRNATHAIEGRFR